MSSSLVVVPFEAHHGPELAEKAVEPNVASWLCRPIEPHGPAWTGFWRGEIVGAAGLTEVYGPGSVRAVAWALFVPMPRPAVLAVVKEIRAHLDRAPYRRIEANVVYRFHEGHRLARALGFQMETRSKPAWTPEGEAVSEYVIVRA